MDKNVNKYNIIYMTPGSKIQLRRSGYWQLMRKRLRDFSPL